MPSLPPVTVASWSTPQNLKVMCGGTVTHEIKADQVTLADGCRYGFLKKEKMVAEFQAGCVTGWLVVA